MAHVAGPRLWTTRKACNTSECHEILESRGSKRSRCHRPINMYAPKDKKKSNGVDKSADTLQLAVGFGGQGGGKSNGGKGRCSKRPAVLGTTAETRGRLLRMIGNTPDLVITNSLKNSLLKQLELLDKPAAAVTIVSATDAVKRAEGIWKDVNMRNDQAINSVIRLRNQLAQAENKERELAKELASAEVGRCLAAKALAVETGAIVEGASATAEATGGSQNWYVQWDEEFFAKLEEYECVPAEREQLIALEKNSKRHVTSSRSVAVK